MATMRAHGWHSGSGSVLGGEDFRGGTLLCVVHILWLQLSTQMVHNLLVISQSSPCLTKWMHDGQGAGHGEAEVWLAHFPIPSALLEQWLQPPIHILQAP